MAPFELSKRAALPEQFGIGSSKSVRSKMLFGERRLQKLRSVRRWKVVERRIKQEPLESNVWNLNLEQTEKIFEINLKKSTEQRAVGGFDSGRQPCHSQLISNIVAHRV